MELSQARAILSSSSHGDQQEGGHDGVEIVHVQKDWLEIISSEATEASLSDLGLGPCYRLLQMRELVETELKGNFESLQYHMTPEDIDQIIGGRGVSGAGGGERREGEETAREMSRGREERKEGVAKVGRVREVRDAGRRRGEAMDMRGYTYDHYVSPKTLMHFNALSCTTESSFSTIPTQPGLLFTEKKCRYTSNNALIDICQVL